MRSVLFVDDEPRILDGLRRMLRTERKHWRMGFANGGLAALDRLSQDSFDVIVTDMRMPGMDGAELLKNVREKYPSIVRIVLSGHTDQDAAMRAVPVAHQFLSKPCEPEQLREAVRRGCALHSVLEDDRLRSIIGRIKALPTPPETYLRLRELLEAGDADIEEIVQVIEDDTGMTAKILQLVNSSFFGLGRTQTSLHDAAVYLGTSTIYNLTLTLGAFQSFDQGVLSQHFDISKEQVHANLCARIARRIAPTPFIEEPCYLAAKLHDIGKLVLATCAPDLLEESLSRHIQTKRPFDQIELELHGVTHAEIGGYLLGLWGVSSDIVEAVIHHHQPLRPGTTELDVLGVVHIANALAHELQTTAVAGADSAPLLNNVFLTRLGLVDRVDEWRRIAREEFDSPDADAA